MLAEGSSVVSLRFTPAFGRVEEAVVDGERVVLGEEEQDEEDEAVEELLAGDVPLLI